MAQGQVYGAPSENQTYNSLLIEFTDHYNTWGAHVERY